MSEQPTQIHHVTLVDGLIREFRKSDIGESMLADVAPVVREAETHTHAELGPPEEPLELTRIRANSSSPHTALWLIRDSEGQRLVTMALAMEPKSGERLWAHLHTLPATQKEGVAIESDIQAPIPWLAVVRHFPLFEYPVNLGLEYFVKNREPAIAWAWIEAFHNSDTP